MSTVDESEREIVATGIKTLVVVLVASSALLAVFNRVLGVDVFQGWISTWMMCGIPFQVVVAVLWGFKYPPAVSSMRQPLRGMVYTGLFLIVATAVLIVLFTLIGRGSVSPILTHYVILSVGVTLLVNIVFGGWPVRNSVREPFVQGVVMLVYCYLLTYIVFRFCFDYELFRGAPFYRAEVDPGGAFNGITALTFAVTGIAVMMMFTLFEMWPIAKILGEMHPAVVGVATTACILGVTFAVYSIAIQVAGLDAMQFMVAGPVCFIFGVFVVDNLMQFQLFAGVTQPLKGVIKVGLCLACAIVMYTLYGYAQPVLVGDTLLGGPENNDGREIWIANAMLATTFPMINVIAGDFGFWPIKRESAPTK